MWQVLYIKWFCTNCFQKIQRKVVHKKNADRYPQMKAYDNRAQQHGDILRLNTWKKFPVFFFSFLLFQISQSISTKYSNLVRNSSSRMTATSHRSKLWWQVGSLAIKREPDIFREKLLYISAMYDRTWNAVSVLEKLAYSLLKFQPLNSCCLFCFTL